MCDFHEFSKKYDWENAQNMRNMCRGFWRGDLDILEEIKTTLYVLHFGLSITWNKDEHVIENFWEKNVT